jgi:hypothetical protein
MKKWVVFFASLMLLNQTSIAQIKYYIATGKDSITYIAGDYGLLVLSRDSNQELLYHSTIDDSNKVYTKALDNDNYLILGTNNKVDIYSLENKYIPSFIGSLTIPNIVSIRPFGDHFAILRNNDTHYIVGVEQDSFKILTDINSINFTYYGRTEFYPEVVYPYFFSIDSISNTNILMYRFNETSLDFEFIDTLNLLTPDWEFVQMYGGKDRFYMREKHGISGNYNVNAKKYLVSNDTLYFLSQQSYNIPFGFIEEIECTDTLIRFNGGYTYLNGMSLNEPNRFLFSVANLSGIRIYNTHDNTKFYYSTTINGTTINSTQFIYNPSSIEEKTNLRDFIVYQNYPNPFNPKTKINFTLSEKSDVTIKVYNTIGELVSTIVRNSFEAGYQSVDFNASGLTSGVYVYRIEAKGNSRTLVASKKMLLLK